jgi:beta-N-acetylhexosaminidase
MASLPELADLSLEAKIGQMLCLGWGGPDSLLSVNVQAREGVCEMQAGAMIVMGRNVQPAGGASMDAAAVRAMLDELQTLAATPLVIATDQEGGRVARFGAPPFTPMPPARVVGRAGDLELARRGAWATARELAAVGVNWDFAPVADIDSNSANPVIGDRAFAADAETVGNFVTAQVRGYAAGGVLACAKHFPGHGDTSVDSHFDLPTLPFDLESMDRRELLPFRAAIAADCPTIMTAHICFPAVDPTGVPATLSRPILTGLLRERLGFTGLVVTDCREMRAVADGWGTARAAVLAACAGADMLLICHSLVRQREAKAALLAAARSGELPVARIDGAVERILRAKRRAADLPRPDLTVIGAPEHLAIRRALAGDAATAARTTIGAEAPV